jgi:hypothetical protein
MRTLLYEVTLRNPITKEAYPEEFVGLRSISGIKPGSEFYIEVSVDFSKIPSKNGLAAQTVEVEATVNGKEIGWVFDVTPTIPTCTFTGFPSPAGTVTPFRLEERLPTIIPDEESAANKNDDDNEWMDELKTVEVHATVIYSFDEEGFSDEDPIPSDFFQFPVNTLYYHTIGTMETLKSYSTKQNRTSAEALNAALSAAITQAEYNDFYADKYDPNDDSNDAEDSNDDKEDDDSEIEVVGFQPKTKRNEVANDEDDDDDDDWWETSAQPNASLAIQQQKQHHQQLLRKHQSSAISTQIKKDHLAPSNNSSTTGKKRTFSASASEHQRDKDEKSSSDIDQPPPAKRQNAVGDSGSSNNNKPGIARNIPAVRPTVTSAPVIPLPLNKFTFASGITMDSDSEGD